jgi:hypothetical protein
MAAEHQRTERQLRMHLPAVGSMSMQHMVLLYNDPNKSAELLRFTNRLQMVNEGGNLKQTLGPCKKDTIGHLCLDKQITKRNDSLMCFLFIEHRKKNDGSGEPGGTCVGGPISARPVPQPTAARRSQRSKHCLALQS